MDAPNPDVELQISSGSSHYSQPFPAPDKLTALFVLENNNASSGTLAVTPEHSNDGVNWIGKTALQLSSSSIGANTLTTIFGYDDGSQTSMVWMRFNVTAGSARPYIRAYLSSRTY